MVKLQVGLTAEHLQFSHPALALFLVNVFKYGMVPDNFGNTYTVPIPKSKLNFGKALSIDDFRYNSIFPVISKVFEHCVLNLFDSLKIVSPPVWVKKGIRLSTCPLFGP